MSNTLIGFGIRGAQILFAIIILGLSSTLIKGHDHVKGLDIDIDKYVSNLPITLGFAAFVGAATLVGALVGVAAHFFDRINERIMQGIDGFVLGVNLAGGLLIALKLKNANCAKSDLAYRQNKLAKIDILRGGCDGDGECLYDTSLPWSGKLNERCKMSQADSAFMFLTVIILAAWLIITWVHLRRK
ncbi:hypothetical protein P154DRAFT_614779 [Amniculicola lignicola CBS 123094]|uniref:MARVEL domain-containing protein n=1 Tax=Amniculicola lignicola CBS 123094 TaxID=1392246 RepID=A0A6A5X3D7_9PLEO|nr:hypothetical protein P154DRAFT_614779 [Amniculicola lignicola CBS 123094]